MGCLMTVVYSAKGVCCIPITRPHYNPIDPKARSGFHFLDVLTGTKIQVVKNKGGKHVRHWYGVTFQEREITIPSKTDVKLVIYGSGPA